MSQAAPRRVGPVARAGRVGVVVLGAAVAGIAGLLAFSGADAPIPGRSFSINSGGMRPTLDVGDVVLASTADAAGRLTRGDVVEAIAPGSRPEAPVIYVERAIGLPGDRVQVRGGVVYLNGAPLAQRFVAEWQDDQARGREFIETLPDGRMHRVRRFEGAGSLANDTQAWAVPPGQLFLLGDNRDDSADSRFAPPIGLGLVPVQNLVARNGVIIWSHDLSRVFSRVR